MSERIEVGDFVNIYFEYIPCEFNVEVLYTPCATGDSWSFKREDGTIVGVQSFGKMVKCGRSPVDEKE